MQHCDILIADMHRDCQPTDADKNNAILPSVVSGDASARERLIRDNMVFVLSRVNSYIRRRPEIEYLRDDMTSAGLLGVCKAVNKIVEGTTVSNVTAYLSYWINREILLVLEAEAPVIQPDDEEPLVVNTDVDSLSKLDDVFTLVDLREVIYSCCETDEERRLLELREFHGLNCQEIAPLINVSQPTAYRMLTRIEQRFNEKMSQQ